MLTTYISRYGHTPLNSIYVQKLCLLCLCPPCAVFWFGKYIYLCTLTCCYQSWYYRNRNVSILTTEIPILILHLFLWKVSAHLLSHQMQDSPLVIYFYPLLEAPVLTPSIDKYKHESILFMCIVQTMKQDVTREDRGLHSMARKLFQKGNNSFIRVSRMSCKDQEICHFRQKEQVRTTNNLNHY